MDTLFYYATSANPDVLSWDTSNVQYFSNMFGGTSIANPNTSSWVTSSGLNFTNMFYNAISANPDLSNWNFSSVNTNLGAFLNGSGISTLNYSNMLINISAQSVTTGLSMDNGTVEYSAGAAATARDDLVNNDLWNITDGGQAP